mgnify:CR=1 FL=1
MVYFYNVSAGEYVYWEKKKDSPSGRITAHVRICCAKNYMDNKTANTKLQETLEVFTQDFGQWVDGYEVSDIYLRNHFRYRVVFDWDYKSSSGRVVISGGLENSTMDIIYDSGFLYESYNKLLEFYKKQCNNYLEMI